jgi:hypothetical protein
MAALTGVDPNTESVKSEFDSRIAGSLPTGSKLDEFMASHQVAVIKIAALFCREAFESPSSHRNLYAGVDLYRDPRYGFEMVRDEDKAAMAAALVDQILRPSEEAEAAQQVEDLLGLFGELEVIVARNNGVDGQQQIDSSTMARILKSSAIGSCTALLSSAGVTMY